MNVSDSSKTKSTAVPLVETANEKARNPIGSDGGVKTEAEQQDLKEVAGRRHGQSRRAHRRTQARKRSRKSLLGGKGAREEQACGHCHHGE